MPGPSAAKGADVPQTYSKKTFHRKFEETYGYLTPDQFPPLDLADREQLQMLLPAYRREQLQMEKDGKKLSKVIEVDNFNLRVPDNSRDLFKQTKLYLEPNKRAAIYGTNGSGKTTLFRAIVEGEVKHFPKHMSVHHMREMSHDAAADAVSVIDTVLCSHPERRVYVCLEEYLPKLIEEEKDAERKEKLEANLDYVKGQMTRIGGYTAEKRVIKSLRVLGFDEAGDVSLMSSLSGGLRMRVALASAFFIDPDLLLLDEPTNHLDMPSVLWLENALRSYKGSYLMCTHDRTLLENVVTSVLLIEDLKLLYFDCGFKEFEKRKAKHDQDRDRKIDKWLAQNRNLDPSSPMYRTKVQYQTWQRKRQERMVLLAGKFNFKAPKPLPAAPGQDQKDISLIKVDNVRFSYDVEKGLPFIFDTPISYEIKTGTRVGIMGPNGAGKSTFLKLVTGKLQPVEGSITTSKFDLAYFGQHSTKELGDEDTALEFMISSFPDANEGELKNHLEKTSIAGDDMHKRMKNLSFSQRSCVIFAKLTFVPPHLLILDEPTNFLDLDSVDALIRAVNGFQGATVLVTHNRDFLRRCSQHFLSIVPGAFLEFKTMKDAERATYSFISALEQGKQIDHKTAILQNRGGGAIHTEEYLEESRNRITQQQVEEQAKAAAKKAEEDRLAAIAEAKAAKRAAKLAAQKTDWVTDEVCWAPVKGKSGKTYVRGVVKRNIPNMGVSVELSTGKTVMIEAKKLRVSNPTPGAAAGGDSKPKGGAKGGAKGGKGGKGGRDGAKSGRGGRGGGRGGRGGRK